MNKSIFLPVTILSAFLLFASCNDNGKTSSNNHTQDDKEYSVPDSDSVKQKTIKDTTLSFEKNNASQKRVNEKSRIANLQDFRKRTVSKYFAGTLADSLSVGRAELKVPCGSMEHAKILSITPLRKGELAHLPAGMVNVTADRSNPTVAANSKDCIAGYRFLPHGEHFVHHLLLADKHFVQPRAQHLNGTHTLLDGGIGAGLVGLGKIDVRHRIILLHYVFRWLIGGFGFR